jgi:hypothetical protein
MRDRFTKWHEIGHVFDYQALTDEQRAWFARELGFNPASSWLPEPDDHESATAGEVFADAYAMCAMNRSPAGSRTRRGRIVVNWQSGYGYMPTVRQHRRVCNAIWFVAIARGYR